MSDNPPSESASRFDALLRGADVDSELRSFLDGVPGVTLPQPPSGSASASAVSADVLQAVFEAGRPAQAASLPDAARAATPEVVVAPEVAIAASTTAPALGGAVEPGPAAPTPAPAAPTAATAFETVISAASGTATAAASAPEVGTEPAPSGRRAFSGRRAAAREAAQRADADAAASPRAAAERAVAEQVAIERAAAEAAVAAREAARAQLAAQAEQAQLAARVQATGQQHAATQALPSTQALPTAQSPSDALTQPVTEVLASTSADDLFGEILATAPQTFTQQAPAQHPFGADPLAELSLPDFSAMPELSAAPAAKPSRAPEIEQAMMAENPEVDPEFVASVAAVLDLGASDLHLVAESTPVVRIDGQLKSVADTSVWDRDRIARVIAGFVPADQMRVFAKELELDLAYSVGDIARFRVNIFQDQRGLGAALRIIPTEIKSVTQLGLPRELVELANLPRGLVLVCGPTGSGKSTTLAAIIDRANSTRASHIVTVEDPIEFLHNHKRGIINQREVGADTHSFSDALKHALRQDPDIILVGEMRDLETISTALTAAETGHLVFATLHTQDAGQTIDRVIDVYPAHQQAQVRTQLAATLRAVVVQTLIPRASGKGRAVATEVMFTNPAIQSLIRAGKTHQLRTALQAGTEVGMHTLDQDLARLVLAGDIEYGAALELAQDVAEFDQLVRNRGISRAAAGDLVPEGVRQTAGGERGGI